MRCQRARRFERVLGCLAFLVFCLFECVAVGCVCMYMRFSSMVLIRLKELPFSQAKWSIMFFRRSRCLKFGKKLWVITQPPSDKLNSANHTSQQAFGFKSSQGTGLSRHHTPPL